MSQILEFNPHFHPQPKLHHDPHSQKPPRLERPKQQQPRYNLNPHQEQHDPRHGQPRQPHYDQNLHQEQHDPRHGQPQQPHYDQNPHQQQHDPLHGHPRQPHYDQNPHQQHEPRHGRHGPKVPQPQTTKPLSWSVAIACAILLFLIILIGLIVLIIYLVFRPKSPSFGISNASLNNAYIDTGSTLNADLTILANFTNPNKKVKVSFSYIVIGLYYENTLIARSSIEPFSARRAEVSLQDIHMVTSEVRIPVKDIQMLMKQMGGNAVKFEIRGLFRTRSKLGSLLRYSYWLHSRCDIVMTNPPSGVLLSSKCKTKR
ncbi:hypothetical protein GIB67_030975 [Kingdonia uniflora]|uniref:Late embryogenesis abundant protein LEA-2 subgroup domain-containing protein n=1 Tax=Kingdonia uniflora TaxID=39325 RepID=A0A7J7L3K3_9MAGN|nr:hypothetical protein GIB67_030975 [Kingdonia uniflora]